MTKPRRPSVTQAAQLTVAFALWGVTSAVVVAGLAAREAQSELSRRLL